VPRRAALAGQAYWKENAVSKNEQDWCHGGGAARQEPIPQRERDTGRRERNEVFLAEMQPRMRHPWIRHARGVYRAMQGSSSSWAIILLGDNPSLVELRAAGAVPAPPHSDKRQQQYRQERPEQPHGPRPRQQSIV